MAVNKALAAQIWCPQFRFLEPAVYASAGVGLLGSLCRQEELSGSLWGADLAYAVNKKNPISNKVGGKGQGTGYLPSSPLSCSLDFHSVLVYMTAFSSPTSQTLSHTTQYYWGTESLGQSSREGVSKLTHLSPPLSLTLPVTVHFSPCTHRDSLKPLSISDARRSCCGKASW